MIHQKKFFIHNRKNQKLAIVVSQPEKVTELCFIMHGLGAYKEQDQIVMIKNTFLHNNIATITFDCANSIGESEGRMEDATITSYYEDLEDVIDWANSQTFYTEPFWLAGHSLGGISILLYTKQYTQRVKALAPLSTIISGKLSIKIKNEEEIKNWQKTGWKIEESKSRPGVIKRLPWSHMKDRMKYDALAFANTVDKPLLLVVGENDDTTPREHQQILYENWKGEKEMYIIKNANHTFRTDESLNEVSQKIDRWIKKYKNPVI